MLDRNTQWSTVTSIKKPADNDDHVHKVKENLVDTVKCNESIKLVDAAYRLVNANRNWTVTCTYFFCVCSHLSTDVTGCAPPNVLNVVTAWLSYHFSANIFVALVTVSNSLIDLRPFFFKLASVGRGKPCRRLARVVPRQCSPFFDKAVKSFSDEN